MPFTRSGEHLNPIQMPVTIVLDVHPNFTCLLVHQVLAMSLTIHPRRHHVTHTTLSSRQILCAPTKLIPSRLKSLCQPSLMTVFQHPITHQNTNVMACTLAQTAASTKLCQTLFCSTSVRFLYDLTAAFAYKLFSAHATTQSVTCQVAVVLTLIMLMLEMIAGTVVMMVMMAMSLVMVMTMMMAVTMTVAMIVGVVMLMTHTGFLLMFLFLLISVLPFPTFFAFLTTCSYHGILANTRFCFPPFLPKPSSSRILCSTGHPCQARSFCSISQATRPSHPFPCSNLVFFLQHFFCSNRNPSVRMVPKGGLLCTHFVPTGAPFKQHVTPQALLFATTGAEHLIRLRSLKKINGKS